MDPERWQKLDELFHSALACAVEQREAFIVAACAGDDDLRRELESMLDHYEQAVSSFIERPAFQLGAETLVGEEGNSLIGQTVGPYQLLSMLGTGGMGEVYLAFDTKRPRKVALKFLHSDLTGDSGRVQRFRQEARAVLALNHPHILTIFDIGEIDGRQFIATEFVEGQTLRDLINNGPLELSKVLEVATQIASALSAAHSAGIVHRDIKPENLMLRPDGYLKIVDFGIAKLSEQLTSDSNASTIIKTEAGTAIGTVRYMSPEQVRVLDVDGRTDIWSLGIVIFELVTGRFPFGLRTAGDLVADILGGDPEHLSRYAPAAPAELERIVNKALVKEREGRYQTAGEILHDLNQLKSQVQSGQKLDTVKSRTTRRLLFAVSAVVVLVLLTFAVTRFLPIRSAVRDPGNANAVVPERVISYSLLAQKVRNGKDYEAPFLAGTDTRFENGWKVRINLSSPQSGFLYLLAQEAAANGKEDLRMLYPEPSNGSIALEPNQVVPADLVFDQNPGVERATIVWSLNPVPELEAARRFLNAKDQGIISGASEAAAVRQFLARHRASPAQIQPDAGSQRTVAKAKSDVLTHVLELEHR
jgi:serine/threonine protein kinase